MLRTSDYDYDLPEGHIAAKPFGERSASRLLVYQNNGIQHSYFDQIDSFLPVNSLLVLNDSKVIPARLIFKTYNESSIEIFLLEPYNIDHSQALSSFSPVTWKCMIGNRKRWKSGQDLRIQKENINLTASCKNPESNLIEFTWNEDLRFSEIIEALGAIPLPPYLKREATEEDRIRYQTVYACSPGAVAAPTAGLHFTPELLAELEAKGHMIAYLTLHVGAGTFLPVKAENALMHQMHEEQVVFQKRFIEIIAKTNRPIIAIGTTSMRALESLYWAGVGILEGVDPVSGVLKQDFPYFDRVSIIPRKKSLERIVQWMEERALESIRISTSIFIRPGYHFGLCDGLVTNFHQPKSTLLMLVSAFIGDHWREVYESALKEGYRFLSYGDSSFFTPKRKE